MVIVHSFLVCLPQGNIVESMDCWCKNHLFLVQTEPCKPPEDPGAWMVGPSPPMVPPPKKYLSATMV